MKSTQVATWRKYTTAEKKAFQARRKRRGEAVRNELLSGLRPWQRWVFDEYMHHFADNKGRRVPTIRPRGEVL